jgi:hypothetical protein
MPSIVSLDIFSGRENPSWVVDDDKVADLQRLAAGARLGPLPILGYRGFHVRPVESEHAPAARLEGLPESAAGARDAVIVGQPEAEEFLLSTAAEHIDDRLRAYVRESITRGPDTAAMRAAEAPAAVACPPLPCPRCAGLQSGLLEQSRAAAHKDKVGCWSHKPGSTAARNTDNSGRAIRDPRTCDRGSYTNFCTYMITTRHVRIR